MADFSFYTINDAILVFIAISECVARDLLDLYRFDFFERKRKKNWFLKIFLVSFFIGNDELTPSFRKRKRQHHYKSVVKEKRQRIRHHLQLYWQLGPLKQPITLIK